MLRANSNQVRVHWPKAEGVPVQGIFAVAGSPKMLEVAKHDMRRPAAGPVPRLVG